MSDHVHRHTDAQDEQHQRDLRDTARYDNLMHVPLTLSTAHKVIGIAILLGSVFLSVTGSYVVNRTTTEYRLVELEKVSTKQTAIIEQMQQHGFEGHEIRLTRQEAKTDAQQQSISEIKAKVDTSNEILKRVEEKLDRMENRATAPQSSHQ